MVDYEKYFATSPEIERHNREVREVWEAYRAGRPVRVPTDLGGLSYTGTLHRNENYSLKKYFEDPEEMLTRQAETVWLNDNIILQDALMRENKPRTPFLDYELVSGEAACWGCPVILSDRQQPKILHLLEGERTDPAKLPLPGPFDGGIMRTVYRNYLEMKKLAREFKAYGVRFGEGIELAYIATSVGLFNGATQLRGTELFTDIYEDPDYVVQLLDRIAEGYAARSNAWLKMGRENGDMFGASPIGDRTPARPVIWDHGIDMISMRHYRQFLVPAYERLRQRFGQEGYDDAIEHCGHGEAVIRFKRSHYGVRKFVNVNTAFIDVERLRHDLGDDVELEITIGYETVLNGPAERIVNEVKEALRPEVKRKGNLVFGLHAYNFTAPLEHLITLYEAVREYGRYD